MPAPTQQTYPLTHRLRIAALSIVALLVTTACALLGERPTPQPTCYTAVPVPSDTPEPIIMCYEVAMPSETPTPPDSPLETPTPTPTAEARRWLREDLLTRGRFPKRVAQELRIR